MNLVDCRLSCISHNFNSPSSFLYGMGAEVVFEIALVGGRTFTPILYLRNILHAFLRDLKFMLTYDENS